MILRRGAQDPGPQRPAAPRWRPGCGTLGAAWPLGWPLAAPAPRRQPRGAGWRAAPWGGPAHCGRIRSGPASAPGRTAPPPPSKGAPMPRTASGPHTRGCRGRTAAPRDATGQVRAPGARRRSPAGGTLGSRGPRAEGTLRPGGACTPVANFPRTRPPGGPPSAAPSFAVTHARRGHRKRGHRRRRLCPSPPARAAASPARPPALGSRAWPRRGPRPAPSPDSPRGMRPQATHPGGGRPCQRVGG